MTKNKHIKGEMVLVEIICTILFCVFTFCFLYFFQADVLGYAQQVLSEGATTYSPFVGMLLILVLCLLLKLIVEKLHPVYHIMTPASSWFPSALLVAVLTDCHVNSATDLTYGSIWIWGAVLLFTYIFVVWLTSKVFPFQLDITGKGVEWKALGANLAGMCVVLSTAAMLSNTNLNEHVILRMERLAQQQRYEDIEKLDKKVQLNDSNLVRYRAFALEKRDLLGEKFFETTHDGNGHQLFSTYQLTLPTDSLYRQLRVRPAKGSNGYHALEWLRGQKKMAKFAKDYLLTAYLMDCRLDDFVNLLAEQTDTTVVADTLAAQPVYPKHFREALTIYNHQTQHPLIVFTDPSMEEDYKDFLKTIKDCPDPKALKGLLSRNYRNTYWYYYILH